MLKHWVIGIVASAASAFTASADLPPELIKSYNSAIGTQDTAKIVSAAEALAAAAVADPTAPDAALIAFETASQLCLRGACARAADAARLAASGTGADLPPASERALLAAYAAWSAAPGSETLVALDGALSVIAAEPPTLISVNAFGARYVAEAKSGSPKSLSREARRAADHFRPARDLVPQYWATAELTALTTEFNSSKDTETLIPLRELEYWLYDKRISGEDAAPEWMSDLYFKSMAWAQTVKNYGDMGHGSDRVLREAAELESARKVRGSCSGVDVECPPLCPGDFERALDPEYPSSAVSRGYFGTVVIGVSIEDEEVVNARVLAAVPDNTFEEAALKSLAGAKWKYKPDPPAGCQRKEDLMLVPFAFVIE